MGVREKGERMEQGENCEEMKGTKVRNERKGGRKGGRKKRRQRGRRGKVGRKQEEGRKP